MPQLGRFSTNDLDKGRREASSQSGRLTRDKKLKAKLMVHVRKLKSEAAAMFMPGLGKCLLLDYVYGSFYVRTHRNQA